MAFGLNLGHDYRQGALSWQGSDGKSKTGSYLSCLLLLASPFQPHSPDRGKHCSPLASWWAASVVQFKLTLLALCLSMEREKRQHCWGFLLQRAFLKSRKQRCPSPARGMCRSASVWGIWVEDRPCTALWSEKPETNFWKDLRAALQLQLTAQNVSCQTGWQSRAWQIQDLCWLSGTRQWAGSSSEFRNSLPSPEPQGASWIYSHHSAGTSAWAASQPWRERKELWLTQKWRGGARLQTLTSHHWILPSLLKHFRAGFHPCLSGIEKGLTNAGGNAVNRVWKGL